MDLQLGYYPQAILLVVTRVAAVMATVPFFGGANVSMRFRVAMAFVVALALIPAVPPEWAFAAARIHTMPGFLFAILSEVLLGAAVGMVCHTAVGACAVAGMITSRGSSLMMAQSVDPISGKSSQIMQQILQLSFVILVLLSNAHLIMIKLIAGSFQMPFEPLNWVGNNLAELTVSAGRIIFLWGFKLALPVMCASLVINVCLGLIARLAPDFNVLFLSLPVRLTAGIALFGLVLRSGAGFFEKLTEQMLTGFARLLIA